MIGFLQQWMLATWQILCESGLFLLLGFVIAGFLKALVPQRQVFRHLGGDNMKSVAVASLFGVPIPLCSCSVIPTAIALKRSGASKGSTTAFMISTPETGVDSIGVTWALMDPVMTVARPVAALLTAIGCGGFVNLLTRTGWDRPAPADLELPTASLPEPPDEPKSLMQGVFGYSFGTLLDDLTPSFVVGFLASGLITLLVPADLFGDVIPVGWESMLLMLVAGIPLYICAAASTPVAAVLIAKGLDPGAALVFLLAGPATNLATVAVVLRFLGRRVLWVYLIGIAVFALAAGFLVNELYRLFELEPVMADSIQQAGDLDAVSIVAGTLLLLLLLRSAIRIVARRYRTTVSH